MDTIDTLTMNGQTLFDDLNDIRFDPVTKPSHYNINGGMECIDMIKLRQYADYAIKALEEKHK